ncbi:MAG: sugar phosphate isomerase/epimerase [Bryobacterales bacterium]|nr:sugar phosphate isomerase/epimerase [Bryobacterales bacterium]
MLGIDTYSLKSFRWNIFQLLDYAHAQKISAIQASVANFESTEPAYLAKAKDYAQSLHIQLEPGFGCISTLAKSWSAKQGTPAAYLESAIRATRTLEAKCFRVFIAGPADRAAGTTPEAFIEEVVRSLKAIRAQAEDAQVKVAIENHGEFHSRHIRTIIEQAGPSYVAACYDSGNPVLTAEDPLAALESLAPYVVTAHIRDSVVFRHPRGAAVQWVAIGDGSIDMKQLTNRFRALCPNVPYLLEIITGRPPQVIPYLEAEFWKTDRTAPAAGLARFERLVQSGHPFMGTMLIPVPNAPKEYVAAIREQERVDLERSLAYARQHLFT